MERAWRVVIGRPRDFKDPSVFHKISLAVFLAWVGLGSDAITSSAYGPEGVLPSIMERGNSTYLAILLALAMTATVFVMSHAYSRIIEHFPSGGGGFSWRASY